MFKRLMLKWLQQRCDAWNRAHGTSRAACVVHYVCPHTKIHKRIAWHTRSFLEILLWKLHHSSNI